MLDTPSAGLNRAPRQEVERARACGENVKAMAPERVDANILGIALAHSGGAVVGFEDMTKVVIFQSEEAGVGGMPALAPLVGIGGVAEADSVPSPAINLVNTARRSCGDKREVVRRLSNE